MKKLSVVLPVLLLFGFATKNYSLTEAERKYAIDLLLQTEQGVINSIAGLSEAQLNFKPAPEKWSVAECVKHIAVTEAGLWQMTNGAKQAAANLEKRSRIKAADELVVQMIENSANK